ncbi:MAG: hypothetical protein ACXWF8_11710, partial [Methylobacter sp.]
MARRKKFETFFGIIVFVAIAFGAYKLFQFLWIVFSQMNPTVGAGIIAATATVIVSVISVLVAK